MTITTSTTTTTATTITTTATYCRSLMIYLKGRKRGKNVDSEFSDEDSANDLKEVEQTIAEDDLDPSSFVEVSVSLSLSLSLCVCVMRE